MADQMPGVITIKFGTEEVTYPLRVGTEPANMIEYAEELRRHARVNNLFADSIQRAAVWMKAGPVEVTSEEPLIVLAGEPPEPLPFFPCRIRVKNLIRVEDLRISDGK